ncbi:HAD family hydrolase [Herbidospora mongoliensis]|uniref:HAD family hydrolase n=1 Tax=Herbidospora mongoliensis TaxID=688067 RepID=UPI000833911E|nr:HAD family hydrolase [Herbidospora mongoliensis]
MTQKTEESRTEPVGAASWLNGIACLVLDYAALTDKDAAINPALGMPPVKAEHAEVVHGLYAAGFRLVLATDSNPGLDRRWGLREAGIDELFAVFLQSGQLGLSKPDGIFYELVTTAAVCRPDRIVTIGHSMIKDCQQPIRYGMYAALIRPLGLEAGEVLPHGARLIRGLEDLIERTPVSQSAS